MHLFKPKERIVATVGLQGHGKTVFLASLFWDSFFALAQTLKPYAVRSANAKADEVFYGNAIALAFCFVIEEVDAKRVHIFSLP